MILKSLSSAVNRDTSENYCLFVSIGDRSIFAGGQYATRDLAFVVLPSKLGLLLYGRLASQVHRH
jgi:hypothetical protein